jgi:hypothetical protein
MRKAGDLYTRQIAVTRIWQGLWRLLPSRHDRNSSLRYELKSQLHPYFKGHRYKSCDLTRSQTSYRHNFCFGFHFSLYPRRYILHRVPPLLRIIRLILILNCGRIWLFHSYCNALIITITAVAVLIPKVWPAWIYSTPPGR